MRNVCVRFLTHVDTRNAHHPIFTNLQIPLSEISKEVVAIARAFVHLQSARHSADYDHSLMLDKPQVEKLIDLAQSTLLAIADLDRTDDVHYAFLVALYAERTTTNR